MDNEGKGKTKLFMAILTALSTGTAIVNLLLDWKGIYEKIINDGLLQTVLKYIFVAVIVVLAFVFSVAYLTTPKKENGENTAGTFAALSSRLINAITKSMIVAFAFIVIGAIGIGIYQYQRFANSIEIDVTSNKYFDEEQLLSMVTEKSKWDDSKINKLPKDIVDI